MVDPSTKISSSAIALQVLQLGLTVLSQWVGAEISFTPPAIHPAIEQAKSLLKWNESEQDFCQLKLLFSQISFTNHAGSPASLYWPAKEIDDQNPVIPYPEVGNQQTLLDFKRDICLVLEKIKENWSNLSFLSLFLEKYTSHLSLGESNIAYCDLVKMTAAVASAIANSSNPKKICLIAGDLSGIQKFIYTIMSDGALKSLRARSFYLELVTEEVVQQLLEKLELPRSSVIYAGGGNLYLLAPSGLEQQVQDIAFQMNDWLTQEFQGKVFLSLTSKSCDADDVAGNKFTTTWNQAIEQINLQKTQKFANQLDQLHRVLEIRSSYAPCKVCHRDDQRRLFRLNPSEADSARACMVCKRIFRLGGQLFKVKAIVRSTTPRYPQALDRIKLKLPGRAVYYHLFANIPSAIDAGDTVLLINNWNLADYSACHAVPLLLGNYGALGQDGFMTAQEFADHAKSNGGIPRVGYLRMDVDRLGQIFAKGLGEAYSLPRLAGLSRQMSYFFKVYLNSLAEFRQKNFIDPAEKYKFKALSSTDRKNLLFIYAGGDDLFVSGAWNEVVEFAFDVYQSFRAYTGNNPSITLSGGISLEVPKFPLYQAANSSGEAEEEAKGNDRDSLGLFGDAFKWSEWLGTVSINEIVGKTKGYLSSTDHPHPPFLGIWEFVHLLRSQKYNRSFIRNLLLTAQFQEQQVEEKRQAGDNVNDIRYYLHLPKIAYTLARLPSDQRKHEAFKAMGKSFLSPYNAPYFRAIATWVELLNRSPGHDNTHRD
jgi:CRISPR-associated protein Csm1